LRKLALWTFKSLTNVSIWAVLHRVGRHWKLIKGLDPEAKRAGELIRLPTADLYRMIGLVVVTIDDEQEKQALIESGIRELCSGESPIGCMVYSLSKLFNN
jgi:hypothetical protein